MRAPEAERTVLPIRAIATRRVLPLVRPAAERDARSQNATPVGAPTGMVNPVLLLAAALLQFSKKLSSQGKSRGF
jgi:hypothetical protein